MLLVLSLILLLAALNGEDTEVVVFAATAFGVKPPAVVGFTGELCAVDIGL